MEETRELREARLLQRRLEDERRRNAERAEVLSQWIQPGGVGAELGVFQGRFSRTLLDTTQASKLHLIDPWYFLTPAWHWGWGSRSTVDAVIGVLSDFKPEIETSRVLVHVADDRAVLRTFPDGYFDWVYIDSSHQYAHTCDELEILVHKVKAGGLIAGDDWRPDPAHRHHGVYRAVQERLAAGIFTLAGADEATAQWAVRLPAQA